jgi:ribulose 1,5-bisphosphate synthetase/thiazole synthase
VVAYALFRYLLLTLRADQAASAESPENLILRDPGLILAGLLWAGMCVAAMGVSF